LSVFRKLAQVNVVAGLALDQGGGYERRTDLPSTSLLVPWFFVRRPFSALGALAVFRVKLLLLLGAALGSKRLVVSHSAQRAHLAQSTSDSCRWSSGPVAQLARTAATPVACGGRLVLYLLLQLARTTRPKEPDEKGHDHHNEDDHECPHGLPP
jgi:hypothetical protein